MKLAPFAALLAGLTLLPIASCGGGTGDPINPDDFVPFREEWTTVVDNWPFISDVNVEGGVVELFIGGVETSDNFANRGDVEVYYTAPEGTITVQMRRFTIAPDEATAIEDFEKLQFWTYALGSVTQPSEDIEENRCGRNGENPDTGVVEDIPWPSGCQIRVWWDGQLQKRRVGADFRVFVPASWRGRLTVTTEDNLEELEDYPDRGDVKIWGVAGPADVNVDSADVQIKLADNTLPVPSMCTAEQNQACADIGWDTDAAECPCTEFGRVAVNPDAGQAVNITVDAPAGLWMNATLDNQAEGLTPDDDPNCAVEVNCESFAGGCKFLEEDPLKPWKRRVELNTPSDLSKEGLGFNLALVSTACSELPYVPSPSDYQNPSTRDQGLIRVCSGCLDLEPVNP